MTYAKTACEVGRQGLHGGLHPHLLDRWNSARADELGCLDAPDWILAGAVREDISGSGHRMGCQCRVMRDSGQTFPPKPSFEAQRLYEMRQQIDGLAAQRNELMEACKAMLDAFYLDPLEANCGRAVEMAQASIEKAEAGHE